MITSILEFRKSVKSQIFEQKKHSFSDNNYWSLWWEPSNSSRTRTRLELDNSSNLRETTEILLQLTRIRRNFIKFYSSNFFLLSRPISSNYHWLTDSKQFLGHRTHQGIGCCFFFIVKSAISKVFYFLVEKSSIQSQHTKRWIFSSFAVGNLLVWSPSRWWVCHHVRCVMPLVIYENYTFYGTKCAHKMWIQGLASRFSWTAAQITFMFASVGHTKIWL